MSTLTECNYCTLQRMKRKAAERGAEVILGVDEYGWTTARYSDKEEPHTYFLVLTDHCVC